MNTSPNTMQENALLPCTENYTELLEALAAGLTPRDALYHVLFFLEQRIPFESALLFFQDRAQKYSQILLEYNKEGIHRTNRIFRAKHSRTPVARKFFGENYQDIAMSEDVLTDEKYPEDILRMGYVHRSIFGIMLHVDDGDNAIMPLLFISSEPRAFSPAHAALLRGLRGLLTLITRPLFLSHSDELILLGPAGALPSTAVDMLRRCPDLEQMMHLVEVVAPTESTVLILGPTGSGKGMAAEAIHQLSPRNRAPFVQVNCASIPESLLESELFGFERGAFTGAQTTHKGYFEQSHQGTLFLDEVGELSLAAQAKLLHVLEKREIVRVGGERHIPVDVRIVAATHRNLPQMVADGKFREDLLYRLNVFPLRVPPLTERKADIPVLAEYFYHIFSHKLGNAAVAKLNRNALHVLEQQMWPGNVRQLSHTVERAVLLSLLHGGGVLRFDEAVLDNMAAHCPPQRETSENSENFESATGPESKLRAALEKTGWRIQGPGGAAELLGLRPATLRSRMKNLGIPLPREKWKK